MSGSEFAMPQSLELEATRRNGIPAVRRKMVHNTTTQNEYSPGELCYIPLDTGANGAFMDVSTTRLKMSIVVRNKNYFTDFINLPRCGWNAIIKEFGIEVNNTLHELNRHYAECVELDMIKKGENRIPFEMTRSNPWTPADGTAGVFHINFVKPSMVSLMGLPHNCEYDELGNSTPDVITNSYLFLSNRYSYEKLGFQESLTGVNKPINGKINYLIPSSFPLAQSFYDDRISLPRKCVRNHKATLGGMAANGDGTTGDDFSYNGVISNVISAPSSFKFDNYLSRLSLPANGAGITSIQAPADNRIIGVPDQNLLPSYCKEYATPSAEVDRNSLATISFGQSVSGTSPGMWPAGQPTDLDKLDKEIKESYKWVNSDSVLSYYAHTHNIPVGIPTRINSSANLSLGESTIWGDQENSKTQIGSEGHETTFHVSLKVYSSLIGELARRWFPELVVPQGRMRIRIRFQEPNLLFQTLMDPCRRVPGTPRDWFPNLGVQSSQQINNAGALVNSPINNIEMCPPKFIISGVHPILIAPYRPGSIYNSAVAMGKYVVPQMKFQLTHFLNPLSSNSKILSRAGANPYFGAGLTRVGDIDTFVNPAYTVLGVPVDPLYALSVGILSTDSVSLASRFITYLENLQTGVDAGSSEHATRNLAVTVASFFDNLQNNMVIGNPIRGTSDGLDVSSLAALNGIKISDLQNYECPTDLSHLSLFKTDVNAPQTLTTEKNTAVTRVTNEHVLNPYYDDQYSGQCWNPFCFPLPQYVLLKNSSDKRSLRTLSPDDFVAEDAVCFGSHLVSSKAQVRRTSTALLSLNIQNQYQYGLSERLTYIVRDVQLETEQIILPRAAALSIVENALQGGITMETTQWKEMEAIMPKAQSQKFLINMAAAYCTSISFLFRPTSILQGDYSYGYDSFSFYNPFTSFVFDYQNDTEQQKVASNKLGGKSVNYRNAFVLSERLGIDLQLQLSSELIPRFPINSASDLIQSVRWGDQVFSSDDYMDLDSRFQPSYLQTKGQFVNTLQDGFWSCYVPIEALDDQTITDNPFFSPLEMSLSRKIRGTRYEISPLPIYKPYKGSFHISFNLESFMGHADRLRTGVPIVNNNMFLKFEKGYMLENESTQILTVAVCDAKVVFERGGTMQFFS